MKKCGKCNLIKDDVKFSKKGNILQSYCQSCNKIAQQEYFQRNKILCLQKRNIYKQKTKEWFQDYKKNLKCERCPENHIACLEFHHLNPKEKEVSIGNAINRWSIKRILEEIKKCSVLCSNCHRKEHYKN